MNNKNFLDNSPHKAYVLLEDGLLVEGVSFGAEKKVFAELVFNTGMTGYQEILTDPSYAGQIVVMTYPLIGNYGINSDDVESNKVQVSGFVTREFFSNPYHWKSTDNISNYLKNNDVIGVSNIDTRMLTKKIRTKGTMKCLITTGSFKEEYISELESFELPIELVKQVSRKSPERIYGPGKRIAIIDTGIKTNIIKYFTNLECDLMIYPWDVSAETVMEYYPEAIFLSNGPGDPKDAAPVIKLAKDLTGKIPFFGICLGHQILALSLGADTYKLKFGHRGSNHPILDLRNGRVMITSQNHGYAVCPEDLPKSIQVTQINVNDKTIEGFCCPELKIEAVQYHPEAGPGPRDANYIFNDWVSSLSD